MKLICEALQDGQLPLCYSKDGDNVSPPLAWSDLPAGTRELALLSKASRHRPKSRSCSG